MLDDGRLAFRGRTWEPIGTRALFVLPVAFLVLAAPAGATTAVAWRRAAVGILARGGQVALLAGLACLTWFLLEWNLVGWQFG